MRTFKIEPRFDEKTGLPTDGEVVHDKTICDFTGEEIDMGDLETRPPYEFKFGYYDACEEDWYYDNIDDLISLITRRAEELDREPDEFFIRRRLAEEPFIYRIVGDDFFDASFILASAWVNGRGKVGDPFCHCKTLAQAARLQRKRVVIKLLTEKAFTADELGLLEL